MGARTRRRWGEGARWAAPGVALVVGVALVLGALVGGSEAGRAAGITFPQGVTGTVMINASPAPDSAIITVEMKGKECITFPGVVHPAAGIYFLLIMYGGDCPDPGTVVFKVNEVIASGPETFETADPTRTVNLVIGSVNPSPASSATATSTTQTGSATASATSTPTPRPTGTPTPTPTGGLAFRSYAPGVAHD